MKFGVREICDVVLRAKTAQKIGKKIFYKNEPVCYFDTLKASTMEGTATTVYAQGGRGNARLMSWDGERTVTFTMEDALISPAGLAILTGAGLIEAGDKGHKVIQHVTEIVKRDEYSDPFYIKNKPYLTSEEPTIYVMILDDNGEVISEPYLATSSQNEVNGKGYAIDVGSESGYTVKGYNYIDNPSGSKPLNEADHVLVDYYVERDEKAFEVNITPDKFGGTFYLEASTLWRDQGTRKDLPAEFIIPACRVQSNFSFSMSSSGDPSTFTFTMDAFPDYTRWNPNEKVLATIQIIGATLDSAIDYNRDRTWSENKIDNDGILKENDQDALPPLFISDVTYNAQGILDITVKKFTGYDNGNKVGTVLTSSDTTYKYLRILVINQQDNIECFDGVTNDVPNANVFVTLVENIPYTIKVWGIKDGKMTECDTYKNFQYTKP